MLNIDVYCDAKKFIDVGVYKSYHSMHTYISLLCGLKRPSSSDNDLAPKSWLSLY